MGTWGDKCVCLCVKAIQTWEGANWEAHSIRLPLQKRIQRGGSRNEGWKTEHVNCLWSQLDGATEKRSDEYSGRQWDGEWEEATDSWANRLRSNDTSQLNGVWGVICIRGVGSVWMRGKYVCGGGATQQSCRNRNTSRRYGAKERVREWEGTAACLWRPPHLPTCWHLQRTG